MAYSCFEARYTYRAIEGWNVCLDKVMFADSVLEGTDKGNDVVWQLGQDLKIIKKVLADLTIVEYLQKVPIWVENEK